MAPSFDGSANRSHSTAAGAGAGGAGGRSHAMMAADGTGGAGGRCHAMMAANAMQCKLFSNTGGTGGARSSDPDPMSELTSDGGAGRHCGPGGGAG